MEFQLKLIGFCLIGLSLVHVIFPRQFHWKKELSTLSIINREMMMVHTFFVALMLLLVGLLCLTSAGELVHTPLGKRISLGLGLFWLARLYVQFFVYSSATWKGKSFETIVHILFIMFWSYISAVFILVWFY